MSIKAISSFDAPHAGCKRRHSFDDIHEDRKRYRLAPEEESMLKTYQAAVLDHGLNPNALPATKLQRTACRFELQTDYSTNKGKRPVNEDEHVIVPTDFGDIFAVCDGHGFTDPEKLNKNLPQIGQKMAHLVTKSVKEDLPTIIKECNFNTKRAFEVWTQKVQSSMPDEFGGTTAVIGFYEKINSFFHVATIGDSEAVVFRMDNGKIYPFPMSTKINWSTPKRVERVRQILDRENFTEWLSLPTKRRYFPPRSGVNVANSLGDKLMELKGQSAIAHSPECSLIQLHKDDLIMLGCDGVFDFAGLQELIDEVLQPNWTSPSADLAQLVAQYVLDQKKSTDNVTVITVRVKPKTSNVEIESSQSTQPTLSPTQPLSPDDTETT